MCELLATVGIFLLVSAFVSYKALIYLCGRYYRGIVTFGGSLLSGIINYCQILLLLSEGR